MWMYVGGVGVHIQITYCIVPCKCPSPSKGPSSNFDSFVVCEVLSVTVHHAKFLRGDSKVQLELTYTVLLSFRCHYIWQQGLHTLVVALSAAFFTCSTKFTHCKQRTPQGHGNETLGWYIPLTGYSFLLPCWPCLPKKEARVKL